MKTILAETTITICNYRECSAIEFGILICLFLFYPAMVKISFHMFSGLYKLNYRDRKGLFGSYLFRFKLCRVPWGPLFLDQTLNHRGKRPSEHEHFRMALLSLCIYI